ncbi:Fpg/Nei family DNA glycosylase [Chitinophaga horti]|uniref:Fpg/Nei family DNA glycosylase n=1 Tax=Chitinophaga horti TaxID=2920382 RepID=A0ABY6J141_9BACT|nr:DNA-formamidopyrimidine glycosylase family protein [Chitinophaga horti]UYQ93387.1 Fpg/Nei family DNA glycosylase [Chitinophaga horti]
MPELPDLQVFGANLQKMLKGKTVSKVQLKTGAKSNTTAASLRKALEGSKVHKVYREGKELRFAFDNDHVLGMHLMLHGKLIYVDTNAEQKNTLFGLHFHDGSTLSLTDYQGIANVSLDPEAATAPDALSPELTAKYLSSRFEGSRAAVKNLLLDQHVVRGIGNAYADEILWEAGISPFSVAKAIPAEMIDKLLKAIKSVLKEAMEQIRQKEPGIIAGEVRDFLKIHQHKNAESPGGYPILQKTKGGRKTYYTEEQTLFE